MNKVDLYTKTMNEYLENARIFIDKKEWRKVSELLWGAITQALKAVASCKGTPLRNEHKELFKFTEQITKETQDETYSSFFSELNILHANFYEEIITPEELMRKYYPKAIFFIKKLIELKTNIETV